MEKVKLTGLSHEDMIVISEAAEKYAQALNSLLNSDNTSQQNIHYSILNEFRYELVKRITKREPPKENTLKMEVHTAFVVYDCLQHYSKQTSSQFTSAVLRRIIMELFSLLPFTKDHEKMSLMSSLNYE